MTRSEAVTYAELPNKNIMAGNGVEYAYRDFGRAADGGVPVTSLASRHPPEAETAAAMAFRTGAVAARIRASAAAWVALLGLRPRS